MNDEIINAPVNRANMLRFIEQGWNAMHAYLSTLSEAQLTTPKDAAGWTVKDHIIHLAVWEDGVFALLEGTARWKGMGLDEATWDGDIDEINAAIQQRYRDMPLDQALQTWRRSHERLVSKIEALTDEDLLRPYRHFQPDSDEERPVYGWIVGNTFGHYHEHKPWMEAIVNQG